LQRWTPWVPRAAPSLSKTRAQCVLTVFSETRTCVANSRLLSGFQDGRFRTLGNPFRTSASRPVLKQLGLAYRLVPPPPQPYGGHCGRQIPRKKMIRLSARRTQNDVHPQKNPREILRRLSATSRFRSRSVTINGAAGGRGVSNPKYSAPCTITPVISETADEPP
jgi:hypothetical protein